MAALWVFSTEDTIPTRTENQQSNMTLVFNDTYPHPHKLSLAASKVRDSSTSKAGISVDVLFDKNRK